MRATTRTLTNRSRISRPISGALLEGLEARQLFSFDPTASEQYMLELLNRMRLNPAAELGFLTSSLGTQAHSSNASINNALVQFQTNGTVLALLSPVWLRQVQVRRKRLALSVRDLKRSLSHSETLYA